MTDGYDVGFQSGTEFYSVKDPIYCYKRMRTEDGFNISTWELQKMKEHD
ncbi:hypothetical protein ACIN8IBEIGE_10179 [Acinetobacter sp. 8I-beige]|nr:hypothetical protein ACIN8IBEIGE_10179 [Acinetobacter sp. 8I-beige]